MKELCFEELTTRQKLGMVFTGCFGNAEKGNDFVYELIKQRSLGAVWVYVGNPNAPEIIKKVKEIADYPILILTDAEAGLGEYQIGKQSALGCTGSERNAYAFGKITASLASRMGYNVICSPVVDMIEGNPRSLGTDKEKVSSMAIAQAKGMHDGGVMCVAKHYPGARMDTMKDTHLTEAMSYETEESLLDYALYPYLKLMEQGLLDGIMTGHKRLAKIDPDHPVSLSKPAVDIIRRQGFEGFAITDALCMMAVRANFDDVTSKGLAVSAGNDLLLPEALDAETSFNELCEAYDKGMIADDVLDAAVKQVLNAQHKATLLPQNVEATEEEKALVKNINRDCIYTITDEGLSPSVSPDGKHFIVMMVRNGTELDNGGDLPVPPVDTFTTNWLNPRGIYNKLAETFPNSKIMAIDEYPMPVPIYQVMRDSLPNDDVIFVAFTDYAAYILPPEFSYRMRNLINALQGNNRIAAMLYTGSVKALEELEHIPRYVIGCQDAQCIDAAIDVLAGKYPAKGTPTDKVALK